MLQLRQNAYTRSQAQCACVHDSLAPNHPSYDCALDKAGVNNNYEDSLINKPPNGAPACCARLLAVGCVALVLALYCRLWHASVGSGNAQGQCMQGGSANSPEVVANFGKLNALNCCAAKNWKPNYSAAAAALALHHTTATKCVGAAWQHGDSAWLGLGVPSGSTAGRGWLLLACRAPVGT